MHLISKALAKKYYPNLLKMNIVKQDEVVKMNYPRDRFGCPICGQAGFDVVSYGWLCGFTGSFTDRSGCDLPDDYIRVITPCNNASSVSMSQEQPKVEKGTHLCHCTKDQVNWYGCKCGGI